MPFVTPVRLALGLTALAGGCVALQTKTNATLADRIGSSATAALVSCTVGLVSLLTLVAARRSERAAFRRFRGSGIEWWRCTGGLVGATFVMTAAYAAQQLGVAVYSVTSISGQIVGAL